jgi:DNA-directed RNA polymerase subunit omega
MLNNNHIRKKEINMLHPSYTDLMKVVNSEIEPGEHPVVNSRYSIVIATAKRARQLINGADPLIEGEFPKHLSLAIEELYESKVKIIGDNELGEESI